MSIWHWLLLVSGTKPAGTTYAAFWQGFGSGPIAWCGLPLVYYRHHMCYQHTCFRIGHPVDGVVKCRKHIQKG